MRDVERSYPSELATHVRAAWPAGARPLPARLESVLDVAYHASFLREEERAVTCRVLVLPPSELAAEGGPPSALLPLPFTTPRSFDEHEIRRLAPAATVHRALIGIEESAGGELGIWGIVQSGPRWLQVTHGGRAREPAMPRCLVIRIVRPGHLVVSCGSELVAELRGGRLSNFALDVFQSKWLAEQFAGARALMASEHRARSRAPLTERAANDLTKHVAQQMIKRVISTMRASHHGGTILVAPPTCLAERHLHTKYEFRDVESRRRFRNLVLAMLDSLAVRAAATGRDADVDFYRRDGAPMLVELDEGLFELSNLIAALAAVDGAVVLTERYEVLGFGAEIAGNLPHVTEVRRAQDPEADTFSTEVVDAVGTRHRSAYRLCAAVPQAVAIVVSQDGSVRFVHRHRDVVTYWDHGPGD